MGVGIYDKISDLIKRIMRESASPLFGLCCEKFWKEDGQMQTRKKGSYQKPTMSVSSSSIFQAPEL